MNGFSEDDVKFLDSFGDFLMKHMRADMSIPEAIQLNKLLAQYNGLRKKVQDHLLEVRKIHTPETPSTDESKARKSK